MITREPRHYTKSSRSGGDGGNCVEWAFDPTGVHIRDSKHPDGPELRVSYEEWAAFTAAAATGGDHPWVAYGPAGVTVARDGVTLHFTTAEWTAFVEGARAGECEPVAA